MKCNECDGTYKNLSGLYNYNDPLVGEISINGIPYYKCDKCGDILLSEKMALSLDQARNNRIKELLGEYPIGDFISAKHTWELLGITRQALNKNQRIRKGFIYSIDFDGVNAFLKQSVLLFKKTGDGRFPLYQIPNSSSDYIDGTVLYEVQTKFYTKSNALESNYSSFKKISSHLEEFNYVN